MTVSLNPDEKSGRQDLIIVVMVKVEGLRKFSRKLFLSRNLSGRYLDPPGHVLLVGYFRMTSQCLASAKNFSFFSSLHTFKTTHD